MKTPPSPDTTRLLLIRHGATPANELRPYILQGQGVNHGLSAIGQRQASALGEFLSDFAIAHVYASPMVRACETAEAVADAHGLPVQTLQPLVEVDVGDWEGESWQNIMQRWPEEYARFMANPDVVPYLGGESYAAVHARSAPAIEELLARHTGQTIVVVAHNVVNRVILAGLLGLPLCRAREVHQENTCVNVIQHRDGNSYVRTMNAAFHLS